MSKSTVPTARRLSMALQLGGQMRRDAVEEIRAALDAHGGNGTHAGQALGVGRETMNGWRRKYPELEAVFRKVRAAHGHRHGR